MVRRFGIVYRWPPIPFGLGATKCRLISGFSVFNLSNEVFASSRQVRRVLDRDGAVWKKGKDHLQGRQ
jgi:hypothetical protein